MQSNRFKRVPIAPFPVAEKEHASETKYWGGLQYPVSVQESGAISHLDCSPKAPHLVAVTGAARVQLYHPDTQEVVKTFSKFKEGSLGATFRKDGRLLAAGTEEGHVKVFEVANKTLLRTFKGHEGPTHRVAFMQDRKSVASFSDDTTVRVWNVATQETTALLKGHTDYVRAGCASETSEHILVSGSYDHSVKVWDLRRDDGTPSLTLDHGSPVESVLLFPGDGLLASAGGHEIRVWDLLSGAGKLLARLSPHNKTITWMGFAQGRTRFVSASLDCQLKFHDVGSFQTVHSIKFPAPILSASVAADDSLIAVGMSNGLVQLVSRKSGAEIEAARAEKRQLALQRSGRHKYLQFTEFTPSEGDIVVRPESKGKEQPHDRCLRRFEYARALDHVLKPYVARKRPEYTYSVLKELKRRGALRKALAGRDEKALLPLLTYLGRNIADARFSELLIEVASEFIDIYCSSLGKNTQVDRLVLDLGRRVERESRNLRSLMSLQGSLDLILSASRVSKEEPELRREELLLRERMDGKPICPEMSLSMDRILLA